MEIKIISEDELHLITYNHFSSSFITVNGEKFDLVHFELDSQTKTRKYFFVKNYFKN